MSSNNPIKLSKVIQFADAGDIRRIKKNYFGSEWNPNGDIVLLPIEKVPTLIKQKVKFNQHPSLEKFSTFVEVTPNEYVFLDREQYAPTFMEKKQHVIALVLQKLGIHEYFIYSDFHANAEIGIGGKKEKGMNLDSKIPNADVSGNLKTESSYNNGVNANAYKVGIEYSRCKGHSPNKEEWLEAKKLAEDTEVYRDIEDIIEMRKPGNNCLECKLISKNIGVNIDANISLASSLQTMVGLGALGGAGGSFLRNFDFNAKLAGYYETTIFYNFDPEMKSDVYQRFVDAQTDKVINKILEKPVG